VPSTTRIEAAAERSPIVRDAFEIARRAHAGQVRNGSGGMPYIEHPVAVAALLDEQGYRDEAIAAALLHDVVEDGEATVEELRQAFGEEVAGMVGAMTDDESIDSYRERKVEHRERVAAAGAETLAIYAADKLSNICTLRATYADEGEDVAREFKVPLDLKLEVWQADLELLREKVPELPFLEPMEEELSAFRDARAASAPRT
jgi:(p)ppGpp synthase/HD superfamily hydrolase